MLNLDEATVLAQNKLNELAGQLGKELNLRRAENLDGTRGWAFAYNTTRWYETHHPTDGLVGNGPMFVDKNTEHVYLTPSGGFKAWIEEYNQTGIPPKPKRLGWVGSATKRT